MKENLIIENGEESVYLDSGRIVAGTANDIGYPFFKAMDYEHAVAFLVRLMNSLKPTPYKLLVKRVYIEGDGTSLTVRDIVTDILFDGGDENDNGFPSSIVMRTVRSGAMVYDNKYQSYLWTDPSMDGMLFLTFELDKTKYKEGEKPRYNTSVYHYAICVETSLIPLLTKHELQDDEYDCTEK